MADPAHGAPPNRNEVQVTVGQDATRALLTVGQAFGNGDVEWRATISSPLDKNDSQTSLATLDGLSNGAKAELALTYAPLGSRNGGVDAVESACIGAMNALIAAREARGQDASNIIRARDARARGEVLPTEDQPPEPGTDCDSALYEAVRFEAPRGGYDALRAVSKAYFGGRPLFTYGLKVGTGYDDFKFLDADYSSTSEHKSGFEVGVNIAMVNVVHLWSVVASVQRQRSYQNTTSSLVQICTPIAGTPAERCASGFLAPPTRVDNTISALEWRWQISRGQAVSVRAAYNHETDVSGLSVPVYLLANKDGRLAGGIKLGWRSDTDDTQVGIFVSSGFNL